MTPSQLGKEAASRYAAVFRSLVDKGNIRAARELWHRVAAVNGNRKYIPPTLRGGMADAKAALQELRDLIKRRPAVLKPVQPPSMTQQDLADLVPFFHGTNDWAARRIVRNPTNASGLLDGWDIPDKQRMIGQRSRQLIHSGLMVHTPQHGETALRSAVDYPSVYARNNYEQPATVMGMIPRKLIGRATNGYESSIPYNWMRYAKNMVALPAGPDSQAEDVINKVISNTKTANRRMLRNSIGYW